MTDPKAHFGWLLRHDGSMYPDHDVERAVLQTNPNPSEQPYDVSLGDLIVQALCHGVCPGSPNHGEDWQTFENAILETLAVDLKVLTLACNSFEAESGETELWDLSHDEILRALHGLARRTDAAAKLARRLREARYGHPSFGGASEEVLVKMAKPEEPGE
jgi:hypothetical protein